MASANINVATGKELSRVGSGYLKSTVTAGVATSFRENFYLKTEVLPAIGTKPFVEIWIGYPTSKVGPKGGATEGKFLTGSSANQIGIFQNNRGGASGWGGLYIWSTDLNTSSDVLAAGRYTVLVTVRRAGSMELWRDGSLIQTFTQSAASLSAQSLILGSFIEELSYWAISSDTVLAARIQAEWSAADVKSFSANPWQLIEAPQPIYLYAPSAATGTSLTPGAGTVAIAGYAPTVLRTANQNIAPAAGSVAIAGHAPTVLRTANQNITPAAGSVTITGYAPSVVQAPAGTSLSPGAGAVTLTGYAPTVARTANLALTPGAGQVVIQGYAPTIFQGIPSAGHELYFSTIMRRSVVNASGAMSRAAVNVEGTMQRIHNYTTIMRRSVENVSGEMSNAPINLTGELL